RRGRPHARGARRDDLSGADRASGGLFPHPPADPRRARRPARVRRPRLRPPAARPAAAIRRPGGAPVQPEEPRFGERGPGLRLHGPTARAGAGRDLRFTSRSPRLSFDEHSADYSQKITEALTPVGLEHGFFFEAKVREILAAHRRITAGGEPRVLEIGCGIGLLSETLRPLLRTVWGIDPSISSLGRAAAPDGRLAAADGLCTPLAHGGCHLGIAVG